jgi:hypothetical protein
MTSPHLTDQQFVARERPFESDRRLWRIQDRFGKGALSGERQSNDARFLNGPIRRLPCRADDEFADAPALDFGGALDDLQYLGLDARGAGRLLWHWFFSLLRKCTGRCRVCREFVSARTRAALRIITGTIHSRAPRMERRRHSSDLKCTVTVTPSYSRPAFRYPRRRQPT